MKTLHALVGIVLIAACVNAHSMRCGNSLVNEGDSAAKVVALCGTPTQQDYSYMLYRHKDGDGMSYRLHFNGARIVDSINFGRDL